MTKQDYYTILGVDRSASKNEIKMAFKKLARQYHPDVAENKEEAEIKFREINEAYAVLSDDEKKSAYDNFGPEGVASAGRYGGEGFPFGGGFGDMGGMGDIFEMLFDMGTGGRRSSGRGRSRQQRPVRGRDVRKDIEIKLEEAFRGLEMNVDLETYQTCPVCNGRRVKPGAGYTQCASCQGTGTISHVQNTLFGQIMSSSTCSKCSGTGQIPNEYCEECRGAGKTISKRKISVKIPAGVDTGNRIRIPEEGEAGEFGGPAGDLYIFVFVKEHERFKRNGKDLILELPIGISDAALGTSLDIKTFDGEETIDVKEGTQPDKILTLKEKGMPDVRGGKHGDLHIRLKVVIPTKLNKKQKDLLRQFAEEGPQFHKPKKGFFDKIVDSITGK